MKSDLDRLMQHYRLDTIFVYGGEEPNVQRNYLMNGINIAGAWVIKKHGAEPVAIVSPMEIDNAARSGLKIYTMFDFGAADIRKRVKADNAAFLQEYITAIFTQLGLAGRVGFYGTADVMQIAWLVHDVFPALPNAQVVYDFNAAQLFQDAYETKDPDEIARLKEAARLSSEVVTATWGFISRHHADAEGNVLDDNGQPLTVGGVKRFILLQNLERGLENAHGMIFAQGRDAGIPHSEGQDAQPLKTGQSIVFDFYPRLVDSGYYHDMTRTWSIGYAAPEVQAVYDQVMNAFNIVADSVKVGDDGSLYQQRVNDYFETNGHKTSRSQPGSMDGYTHSLGHGIGLNIHENPSLGNFSRGGKLARGNVFTIEPGLYYPDQGFGVRVEDTVYFDQDGVLHHLTDFPYDLVLPLKG